MQIRKLTRRKTNGFDTGWLAAYCLDRAVSYFGNAIESKLAEWDEHLKAPKYKLDDLIGEPRRANLRDIFAGRSGFSNGK